MRDLTALVDSRTCRHDNCPSEAYYSRGPGAGLCHHHGLERLRAIQAQGVATRKARGSYGGGSPGINAGGDITAAAKTVVAASRQLERAIVAAYKAEQRRDHAVAQFRRSVAVLLHTANEQLPDHLQARKAA